MLYVTAELDRKILVVDPAAGKVVDAIAHEGSGHWLAVLPDGSKAYVASKNDKLFVSVLDLATRKLVGSVPMPRGTQGVTASPDGKRVIALDYAEPEMTVIDTATDEVVERIRLDATAGAYKAYFSPDGQWLLTMAGTTIDVFDATDLHKPQRQRHRRRLPDGHHVRGGRQDRARRESRRRHDLRPRPRDRHRHENLQGRRRNRDAHLLLTPTRRSRSATRRDGGG